MAERRSGTAPDVTPERHDDDAEQGGHSGFKSVARAGLRGLVGAMAMSGMRRTTTSLGLLEKVPPEEILGEEIPEVVRALPEDRKTVVVELMHWTYGAAAGAVFGLLPDRVRRARGAGPIYGLVVWLGFELVIGPALGVSSARRHSVASRSALAADHVLYGIVVAGQLAPEPAREHGDRPVGDRTS